MCCWHQFPSVLSRPSGRVFEIHEGVDVNNTHLFSINPDYNMMQQYPSLSSNILLIKSKLNLESRAFAVRVAMSPRYLGSKYPRRPHPSLRKCKHLFLFFFSGRRVCWSNCFRAASSFGDSVVDRAVFLKAEFLWHTILSNENGAFYTYDIYIYI